MPELSVFTCKMHAATHQVLHWAFYCCIHHCSYCCVSPTWPTDDALCTHMTENRIAEAGSLCNRHELEPLSCCSVFLCKIRFTVSQQIGMERGKYIACKCCSSSSLIFLRFCMRLCNVVALFVLAHAAILEHRQGQVQVCSCDKLCGCVQA